MIDWRETDERKAFDVPQFAIAYGGKGPRWFGKVEGGVMYVGKLDA